MLLGYGFLFAAIVFEILSSSMLKEADGFHRLLPTILLVIGYTITLFLFSKSLKWLDLGVAYALWGAIGTLFTVFLGVVIFRERLNRAKIMGVACIILGTVMLNIM
ncbi:DMT family transporter [Secundilactobacillus folii]|uniref:EamA family transporter n=1 Tax=Secundilactobacillus folii TaxID=2678357 RepID=A0A7X2XXV8_9LACO|nr:multidrug efflux SMR transporter [Secundilactobacillus folii]MTV83095.1 EamA family transporter [Secundilactobacillus folii]